MELPQISSYVVESLPVLSEIVRHPYWKHCYDVQQSSFFTHKDHNRATHQIMATNIMYELLAKAKNIREEFRVGLLAGILTHDVGHAFPVSHVVERYRKCVPSTMPLWNLDHEAIGEKITEKIYHDLSYSPVLIPTTSEEKVCAQLIASTVDTDRIAYLIYDSKIYMTEKPCPFTIQSAVDDFDPSRGFSLMFTADLLVFRQYMHEEVYTSGYELNLSLFHDELVKMHKSIDTFVNHWTTIEELFAFL